MIYSLVRVSVGERPPSEKSILNVTLLAPALTGG
jgi:hypothetical protein